MLIGLYKPRAFWALPPHSEAQKTLCDNKAKVISYMVVCNRFHILCQNSWIMRRFGFEYILAKHVKSTAQKQPSLDRKRVSPHVLRHTCAMHTLQATRDVRKVALWLGHASLQSAEMYLRADPSEKLEVLAVGVPPTLRRGRFRAPDKLLAMLHAAKKDARYAQR